MYYTLERKDGNRWGAFDTYDMAENGAFHAAVSAAWEFGRLKIPVRLVAGLPKTEDRDCCACRWETNPVDKPPCMFCGEDTMDKWEPKTKGHRRKVGA